MQSSMVLRNERLLSQHLEGVPSESDAQAMPWSAMNLLQQNRSEQHSCKNSCGTSEMGACMLNESKCGMGQASKASRNIKNQKDHRVLVCVEWNCVRGNSEFNFVCL